MFLYQVLSFFIQLFLLPFFVRILFRFHQIAFNNMLHIAMLQFTNRFISLVSRWIKPSRRIDWPALTFIFIVMFILCQLRSIITIGHGAGLLIGSLIVVVEFFNRICIIYISAGLLSYSSLFIAGGSNKPFIDITYELTNWQLKKVSFLMRQMPFFRMNLLKWTFWVWLLLMIFINLSLEHIIFNLVYQ
ncbi:hypothetical protein EBR43_10015 [bacterium]|nr:hypothetical protein [bacterium]NBX72521.1 hypothetical protein [bacterium]